MTYLVTVDRAAGAWRVDQDALTRAIRDRWADIRDLRNATPWQQTAAEQP
jgi:hypothetical protein